jgi:hypothetical protein
MYRMSYGVIFPDADRDGVRDSLDWWKNDPLYSIDANGNGIPDNADTLWNLSNKNGNNIVVINGKSTTLINAILDGTLLNDKTPPVTESSIQTGTYSSPQSVVLQSNETGVIYYTRDGSTPTKSSLIYTGPVYVDTTTMLRFFSVDLVGNVESAKSIVITTEIPVNGACGFSNGALLAAAPSAELCANATTPSVVGAWNWNCQGINGGETVSCSANQGYLLSVSVSGDGSGTVTSNSTSMSIIGVPNDITCTSGSCSALYPVASEVNVTSTPAIPSEATVSGACNSSPCLLTMDGSKSVTVLFKLAPHVKNNSTGLSYQTLIDALGVAQSGDEIQLLNIGFNGLVTLDKGFTLKGGWDETFTATGSTPSVLKDGLTITGGDSLVELIDIRNKLSIQGGSLRAKGVSIR